MLFNSDEFLVFLLIFLPCYGLVRRSLRGRNVLITVASYAFYAGYDYRFAPLLLLSTTLDYAAGRWIAAARTAAARRAGLAVSLVVNLGILGLFKYAGFAMASLADLLALGGYAVTWQPVEVALPVGISFYTFQSMSYIVDVYRGRLEAERNLTRFAAYVAFFPQLVAGPIERAEHLLPQFARTLQIEGTMVVEGLSLMLRGFFLKVVLGDSLGRLVQLSHDTPGIPGPILILGTVAFGFQIYCDFLGYTNIARGLALILGFRLSPNFDRPYLACSLTDFWRRWHMTLSTWLRDYLYIPLGGSRAGRGRLVLALLTTMVLGGLWHGARLNFLLWGFLHGAALVVVHLWRGRAGGWFRLPVVVSWLLTTGVVFYGWLLFRAGSTDDLYAWHAALASDWSWPRWGTTYLGQVALLVVPLFVVEWLAVRGVFQRGSGTVRYRGAILRDAALLLGVLVFWTDDPPAFIYFQF